MQKAQLAFLPFAIGLLISLLYSSNLNEFNTALTQENEMLTLHYRELDDMYQELTLSHQNLNRSYEELAETYNDLHATYQAFRNQYTSLQANYDGLEDDYGILEGQYSNLEFEYECLESDYQYWKNAYSMLNSKYKEAESRCDTFEMFFDRPLDSKDVPSPLELQSWLILDQTDKLGYHPEFDCKDFSTVLSVKARTRYWDMGIIVVRGYNRDTKDSYAHAFNFIRTTQGIVYVEPQTDEYWWYSDHKEIKAGSTWEISDKYIVAEDIDIIVEG